MGMIFTPRELHDLATPYPDRIINRIRKGEIDAAMALTREMAGSRIILHDFFADSCTILWSWISETLGEETLEPMFRYIFAQSASRQFFAAAGAQVMPHLSVALLAKSWRAHSCFGAGKHPGGFSITEDDEKFTFHLHPCGSGLRLWRKGIYAPGAGGKVSEMSRHWTYGRKGFPYYCIHCPFLNEILPYESPYGALMWPVDPPADASGTCVWHLYKDPNTIPARYYERLGLARKAIVRSPYPVRSRYFSKAELDEIARPVTNRIIDHLLDGDYRDAFRCCNEVRDEFTVLHDLYVNMLASTLTFIAASSGENGFADALDRQFKSCIKRQIVEDLKNLEMRGLVIFLATRIFGTDNCNGTGNYPGKFRITENRDEVNFILDPCGSGGRLLRAGSCSTMPLVRKMMETAEDHVVTFAARRLRLPEPVLRFFFPMAVTRFTQRKSYNLGRVENSYPWSFDQSEISCFCCQCGMFQDQIGRDRLEIAPPLHDKAPCVWRLKK